jgi:hypothetical protein
LTNEAAMTDEQTAELAKRVGLGEVHANYPALVRAAVERGLAFSPALDAARIPTTEPAHFFVVPPSSS